MLNFKGVFTAIVSPFDQSGSFDLASYKKLLDLQIKGGVHGVVVSGTTGESPTLTNDEFILGVKVAKEVLHANKRLLIVGTGTNSTQEAVAKSIKAKELGADALLVVTPYYNKPSQDGLYAHYMAIATAVAPLPVILYDVPGRTGVKMEVDTVARLRKAAKNIIGIKDATGDLNRIPQIKKAAGADFLVLSGDDPLFVPSMSIGADGIISVASNLIPKVMADIYADREGNHSRAEHNRLAAFFNGIFIESNPTPIKWALYKKNIISSPNVRLPLVQLTEKSKETLESIIKVAGV